MRFPQVVVFERDGRLAHVLGALATERRWVLRESRQVEACLRHLASAGPAVLVVRLASEGDSELELLARVTQTRPGVRTVAVGEAASAPGLAGLAWDIGVDFALFPPLPLTLLGDVVAGLMTVPDESRS
jgi:ActR/RegA family two-component response regulator